MFFYTQIQSGVEIQAITRELALFKLKDEIFEDWRYLER
jgi:hypothetical protein